MEGAAGYGAVGGLTGGQELGAWKHWLGAQIGTGNTSGGSGLLCGPREHWKGTADMCCCDAVLKRPLEH